MFKSSDDHVERPVGQPSLEVAPRSVRERVATTHAVHIDAVQLGALGRPGKARAEQRDTIPPPDESAEHLVEVGFRASRLRVIAVQPIDDEDVHRGE